MLDEEQIIAGLERYIIAECASIISKIVSHRWISLTYEIITLGKPYIGLVNRDLRALSEAQLHVYKYL